MRTAHNRINLYSWFAGHCCRGVIAAKLPYGCNVWPHNGTTETEQLKDIERKYIQEINWVWAQQHQQRQERHTRANHRSDRIHSSSSSKSRPTLKWICLNSSVFFLALLSAELITVAVSTAAGRAACAASFSLYVLESLIIIFIVAIYLFIINWCVCAVLIRSEIAVSRTRRWPQMSTQFNLRHLFMIIENAVWPAHRMHFAYSPNVRR